MKNFPLGDLIYMIIGLCMEVHRNLGHGFREVVYKDAIEVEAYKRRINFSREKKYEILYKEIVLPHYFRADFIIEQNLVLEVKATEGAITDEFITQVRNYIRVSGCKTGLIVNFGRKSLEYKRIVCLKNSCKSV